MWLLDQWAERHIIEAQRKAVDICGRGEPPILDDDSHVPANFVRLSALDAGGRTRLGLLGTLIPSGWCFSLLELKLRRTG